MINFPSSPILNQTYSYNNLTWQWNGSAWVVYSAPLTINAATGGTYSSLTGIITLSGTGTLGTISGITAGGGGTTFTGGTVTGPTRFTNGLTANTFSATTYLGLPKDIYVTGGTYSSGTATFKNNSGGTFNVTGFSTGGGSAISVLDEGSVITSNLLSMNFAGAGVGATDDGLGNVTVTIPGGGGGGGCTTTLIASHSANYNQLTGLGSHEYLVGDSKCGWDSCNLDVIFNTGIPIRLRDINCGIPFPMNLIEGDVITLCGMAYCPDAIEGSIFTTMMETFSCKSFNKDNNRFDILNVLSENNISFSDNYVCFSNSYTLVKDEIYDACSDLIVVGFKANIEVDTTIILTWTLNIQKGCK
jgi:hypothetical protein